MLYPLKSRFGSIISRTLGFLFLATFFGCAQRPADTITAESETSTGTKPVAVVTASPAPSLDGALPKAMPAEELAFLQRYRQARSYQDVARLTLARLLDDGRVQKTETTIETRFARPNRIDLRVVSEDNSVVIISDGTHMATRIVDSVTKNFHGQVVFRRASPKLSIADLYQATELVDPIAPEEMLSALLAVPAGLDVLPLGLLCEDGKLLELTGPDSRHTDLGSMDLPTGERCNVVAVDVDEGTYRLWIHDQTLRRIELPPLSQDLMPGVKQLSLSIDFSDVRFAADGDFQIDQDGTKVRHFVLPPIPLVTERLGEPVAALRFLNQNRQEVAVANDGAQATVLVWYADHPESRMVLQAIEQVRQRNRSDRVRLAAVAMDANATSGLLEQWQVETAWLEDRWSLGRTQLGIERAPTVVVLGPRNRLDYFEVGANPNIGADVALVLERLLAGQDVAAATKSLFREAQTNYERMLTTAKWEGDGWRVEPDMQVPATAAPQHLTLAPIWVNDEIQEPGNFLMMPGKAKQLLVIDGWNRLATLNLDGKVTGHIQLDLPENEGISILRAGSNGRDRALLAGASRGGRQAFLFDFAGKRLAEYPAAPSEQDLIADLLVHNIAGDHIAHDNIRRDDEPELIVAWQGDGGVQGIGLDGKQHWSNQAATRVISIAAVSEQASSGRERQPVLSTNGSGQMFLVDENGRTLREVRLDQVVHQFASWPGSARGFEAILHRDIRVLGAGNAVYLGIASASFGGHVLTGIDAGWKTVWSYSMPRGTYRHQVDFPQTVSIPDIGPTWVVPGPDGSVHFLSTDGKFRDQMYVGSHIRGLAGIVHNDQSILVIATDGKITAQQISRKE